MAQRNVELVNRLGLHARAAAKFVNVSSGFSSEITVQFNDEEVNGKSILGLLLLAAPCGSLLTVRAKGEDAASALEAIADLVSGRFGESE